MIFALLERVFQFLQLCNYGVVCFVNLGMFFNLEDFLVDQHKLSVHQGICSRLNVHCEFSIVFKLTCTQILSLHTFK